MVKNHPNRYRLITAGAVLAPAIAMVVAQLGWMAIEHLRTEKMALMLRPVLSGSVLDVGCNDGHLSALLLKKQQDQEAAMNITNVEHDDKNHQRPQPLTSIYGIDPYLPDRVAIPAGRFDGLNIPARDKQYDVAMANFILHHAGRNATVFLLKEMKRVSRRVVVSEDHVETSLARASVMAIHEILRLVLNMGYDMDGFRTKVEWKRTFEDECGFRVVAQRDYSSVIFLFPFLYHTVYVLEDKDGDIGAEKATDDLLFPPLEEFMMYQPGWSDAVDVLHVAAGVVVFYLIAAHLSRHFRCSSSSSNDK
jgi:SAM-dependent methyltransferase